MKISIDRTGWSTKRMVIQDMKDFPKFLIGVAPECKGEHSMTFDNDPMLSLYSGHTTYCFVIMALISVLAGYWFCHIPTEPASFAEKILIIIISPMLILCDLMISYLIASLLSIPFTLLNELFDSIKKENGQPI